MPKLITLPPIDPAHFRNLIYAARAGLKALQTAEIIHVGQSMVEIEAAFEKGVYSDFPVPAASPSSQEKIMP